MRKISLFCTTSTLAVMIGSAAAAETISLILTSEAVPRFELAAEVFKERTGHDVEITSTGYDQSHALIVTSQEAGSAAYDIAKVDTIWLAGFATAGYCVPLNDRISEEEWEDTLAASRAAMTYQDDIWAKGGGNSSVNFYYNAAMLDEAGIESPPQTIREVVEQAREIVDQGLAPHGMAWGWSQGEGLVLDYVWLVKAMDGSMQNDDGEFIFNQGAGVEVLEWMTELIGEELINPASLQSDNRAVVQIFIRGDVPFMFNWPFTWSWGTDPTRSQIVDDIRIDLIPPFDADSTRQSATVVGNSGHCVLASSNKQDLAWEFLELATSAEMERRYVLELNDVNNITHYSVLTDPEVQEAHPQLETINAQLEHASNRPELSWYSQFSSVVASALHRAMTGGATAQQALDDAVAELEELRATYDSAQAEAD